jgi:hypothetical protein
MGGNLVIVWDGLLTATGMMQKNSNEFAYLMKPVTFMVAKFCLRVNRAARGILVFIPGLPGLKTKPAGKKIDSGSKIFLYLSHRCNHG